MKTSRRSVLSALPAIPLAGFAGCTRDREPKTPTAPTDTPVRPPEPPPWVPATPLDAVQFPFGVASGDATTDRVLVSARAVTDDLCLVYVVADGTAWGAPVVVDGLTAVGGTVSAELSSLPDDAVVSFCFEAANGTGRSDVGRIRTAPILGSPARVLVFGATSCLGGANPTFQGLQGAANEALDFFLLLGDTVYADGAVTLEDYRYVWDEQRAVPSLRALLASTSVIAAWDDHEIANNWTTGEPVSVIQDVVPQAQVVDGRAAFREAIPQRGDGAQSYRSTKWGDALELFVLDTRGERDWDTQIVSTAQLQWLIDGLQASTARCKLVLSSVHVTDHTVLMGAGGQEDRWQGYPVQRQALLEVASEIPGVVFVTGDMHYGAVQRVSAEGELGEDLWEVAAGPAGSEVFIIDLLADLLGGYPPQYQTVVADWSWTRFTLDATAGTLLVELVDDRGTVAGAQTLAL